MSSLAGALDGYSTTTSYHEYKGADDIDMPGENQSSSANDDPEDSQDQDEEMTDLFGNDNDVEELKAERSVPPFFFVIVNLRKLPSQGRCFTHRLWSRF
jgi:hypothetical protein